MKRLKKRPMKKMLWMVCMVFIGAIWFGGKSTAANLPVRWQGMQTVGDAALLTIRVEFQDVKFTDGIYTEDQLKAMIDGTDAAAEFPKLQSGLYESLNGYYKRSSYGKLNICTGKDAGSGASVVYSYTLSKNREEYAGENGGEQLVKEVLDGLDNAIDYSDYDLDNDGTIDGICINFAGQNEGRDSVWWSHVGWYQNHESVDSWDGVKANSYMIFHTQLEGESGEVNINDNEGHRTLIHETGHMLGLDDYYNFDDPDKGIQTEDMMCYNSGEHNGFSKWLLGWIDDEQIQWITKDSVQEGGIDINLRPISTELPGASDKLIAMIAPTKAEGGNAIYSEYFVVEYDKDGVGNYEGETGFRVFHVDAHLDENGYGFLNANGNGSGNRLIYASALVDENGIRDEYFTDGECLTPDTVESTAFYGGNILGFTGISLTDFKVQTDGSEASFHIDFMEKEEINGVLEFEADREKIGNMGRVTLRSTKPLIDNMSLTEESYYIDASGEKYPVSVTLSYTDAYQVEVIYTNYQEKPLQPNAKYTLVIPAGRFQVDTDIYSEECRIDLTTDAFAPIKKNHTYNYEAGVTFSELFEIAGDKAGKVRLKKCENGWNAMLSIYSDMEEILVSQMLQYPEPASYMDDIYVDVVEGLQCQDGSIVIAVRAYKSGDQICYIYRMELERSEMPAEPYVIEDGVVLLSMRDGVKAVSTMLDQHDKLAVYEIDFNAPAQVISAKNSVYFPAEELNVYLIDQDTYAIANPCVCVNVYDREDTLLYSIVNYEEGLGDICAVTKRGDGIAVFHYLQESNARMANRAKSGIGVSFFDASGEFVETRTLAIDAEGVLQWSVQPVEWGYSLIALKQDGSAQYNFLDLDFNAFSSMETSSSDGVITGEYFVFSGNSINGVIVSVTDSVKKETSDGTGADGKPGVDEDDGTDQLPGTNGVNGTETDAITENGQKKTPATGDEANTLLYIVLCVGALAVVRRKVL